MAEEVIVGTGEGPDAACSGGVGWGRVTGHLGHHEAIRRDVDSHGARVPRRR